MTKRILLAGLISLSAAPALASDVSPFYKGPYAVLHTNDTREAPAKTPDATKKVASASADASSATCKCQRPSS